ncbi:MAG: response regulator [Bacteroidetes bacterium]|nr:response regulator [Bacteroidota bacterium]
MQNDNIGNLAGGDGTPDEASVMRTRRIFEAGWQSSIDAMRLCDSKGTIVYTNPSFCKLFEKTEEQLLGQEFTVIHSFESKNLPAILNNFHETLKTKNAQQRYEGEVHLWNGKSKWVEVSNSFIEFDDELYLLSIFRDITDRKNTEIELTAAKERAEEANRIKSSFLANMSHELRTPLIGIMGFTEILQEKSLDDECVEMLEKIMKSSKRLLQTFESIFDLSLLEANRLEYRLKDISINDCIKSVANQYKSLAMEKGITLELGLPVYDLRGYLDEAVLIKILTNLIDNAVKYTPAGGVKISLIEKDGLNQKFALITVADTGIGIQAPNIALVFDAFRQVSEGYSRAFEGSGLGLTLTKKFVQFLGGTITVESKEGVGSSFSVSLPLTGAPSKLSNLHNKDAENKVKPSLLVIDDDAIARDVFKLILGKEYNISEAYDYETAMALINEKKFDVIILDIMLGRSRMGLNIAQELRNMERYSKTPVVAITALAMRGDREKILEAGCSHYLSKPFRKADLVNIIKEALASATVN